MVATHGRAPRQPYSIAASPAEAARDGWIELLVRVEDDGQPGPHWVARTRNHGRCRRTRRHVHLSTDPEERRFVFIAGGTGIAPLRAMLHHALAIPRAEIGLLYSARSASDFAYEPEFRAMAGAGQIQLRQTVTREISTDWNGPARPHRTGGARTARPRSRDPVLHLRSARRSSRRSRSCSATSASRPSGSGWRNGDARTLNVGTQNVEGHCLTPATVRLKPVYTTTADRAFAFARGLCPFSSVLSFQFPKGSPAASI